MPGKHHANGVDRSARCSAVREPSAPKPNTFDDIEPRGFAGTVHGVFEEEHLNFALPATPRCRGGAVRQTVEHGFAQRGFSGARRDGLRLIRLHEPSYRVRRMEANAIGSK